MSKIKKPAIRFDSFVEEWEQRRVGGLLIERNEQAPMSKEYPLMAFIANEGVVPKGDRYDRSSLVSDVENKLYKKTEKGDFIYSSNNLETGSIGLNKYGKASISPVYSIFQPTGIADSDFLGRRLVRKDFINAMVKWRQGVIYGQWRIHESDFINIELLVPRVEEQRKIGSFLDSIDSLIAQHQSRLEKLQALKASMLEKMFPKDGADVPEVRFKGFTGAWKQHIFEEIAIRASTISDSPELPRVEYEDIISGIGQFNKDIRQKKNKKIGIVFHPGDILYGKLRPYLKNWVLTSFSGLAVGDFWVLQPKNVDSGFLYRLVQSRDFDIVANQSTGTKMPRADWKLVSKTAFSIPHSVEEQYQIGVFFQKVDELIIFQQQELDKLQSIKKALLEKMFV